MYGRTERRAAARPHGNQAKMLLAHGPASPGIGAVFAFVSCAHEFPRSRAGLSSYRLGNPLFLFKRGGRAPFLVRSSPATPRINPVPGSTPTMGAAQFHRDEIEFIIPQFFRSVYHLTVPEWKDCLPAPFSSPNPYILDSPLVPTGKIWYTFLYKNTK